MRTPAHIGIIPDGNRRWAVAEGLGKHEGYSHGLEPGLEILRAARAKGVGEITFYGFTTDNCKRPAAQVEAFAHACVEAVELIATEPVSLLVVGDSSSELFPRELLKYTQRVDINGGGMKVNFLVNYGWQWDLSELEGSKNRTKLMEGIHSHDVSRIDLVIRWGGMRRLSGLLPLQCVYSDFFVVDDMWPNYKLADFEAAMEWYDKQDVTLGG